MGWLAGLVRALLQTYPDWGRPTASAAGSRAERVRSGRPGDGRRAGRRSGDDGGPRLDRRQTQPSCCTAAKANFSAFHASIHS